MKTGSTLILLVLLVTLANSANAAFFMVGNGHSMDCYYDSNAYLHTTLNSYSVAKEWWPEKYHYVKITDGLSVDDFYGTEIYWNDREAGWNFYIARVDWYLWDDGRAYYFYNAPVGMLKNLLLGKILDIDTAFAFDTCDNYIVPW